MSIIVLGARGMLGSAVTQVLEKAYGHRVIPYSREMLDVSNPLVLNALSETVRQWHAQGVRHVVNCAGVIKPRVADVGRDGTLIVNSIFPRLLADTCEDYQIRLIHITTDCVYSGKHGKYTVSDECDVTDDYGWSKRMGEPKNCLVIRTSIIGVELPGQQRSLLEWVLKQSSINGYTNHFWNGMTCIELAHQIHQHLDYQVPELIHLHSPDTLNKLQLCQTIADVYDLDITFTPTQTEATCDRSLQGRVITKTIRQQLQETRDWSRKKVVMTMSGIRPDFIRMSAIFQRLDDDPEVEHVLVHTGQHFDANLSHEIFEELGIRKPDYNLGVGSKGKEHHEQHADLCRSAVALCRKIRPDVVVFLGDSNSVLVAPVLSKDGFKVAHIEAGMRSGNRRMFEEINRITCDHASDLLLTYHANYERKLVNEGIASDKIRVVGNTITEICVPMVSTPVQPLAYAVVDIHRRENTQNPDRFRNIVQLAEAIQSAYVDRVYWIDFHSQPKHLLTNSPFEFISPLPFGRYVDMVSKARLVISDSGTAQEECPLLGVPLLVPRNETERPESVETGGSFMVSVDQPLTTPALASGLQQYLSEYAPPNTDWLGDGSTSQKCVKYLKQFVHGRR